MKVVGISGYARSGKDTLADILVEHHGYTKVAFADKMRDFLYAQNPYVAENGGGSNFRSLQEIINKFGWDGYKSSPWGDDLRALVQRTGTEAGRQTLWQNIWVDAAFKGLDPDGKYVFSDTRFLNEAEAVKDHGGLLLRISRPGVGPALDENGEAHISEIALDDYTGFDYNIPNDGSIDLLSHRMAIIFFVANGTGVFEY
jgi:hypothetical protein